jgi:hypothetical protein
MPKIIHNKNARPPRTEPFHQWLRFHEAFNRTIKTVFAALNHTKQFLTKNDDASKTLAILISDTGEPWGKKHNYNVPHELAAANQAICEAGIVRVWSAFDNFLTMVEADLSSWHAHCGNVTPRLTNKTNSKQTKGNVLKTIYPPGDKASGDLMLIQEYFQILRNCICHRNGEASPALNKCTLELEKTTVWKNVKVSSRKRDNPRPPEIIGNRILLLPRHAIFFSAVCHCLAKKVNDSLVDKLGTDGFVFRAAPLSIELFCEAKVPKTAEGILNAYLHQRSFYGFKGPQVVKLLKQLAIWDSYRNGYEAIARSY